MKKRLISFLLILTLAVSLCAAVCADEQSYVYDETGTLSSEELETLRELGARIREDTGAIVCLCITNGAGEDIRVFADSFYADKIAAENGMLLVHDPSAGRITYVVRGEKLSSLGDEKITQILDAYNSARTYFDGAHDYMNLVYAALGGPGFEIPDERQAERVVDLAGVIDAARLASLNTLADQVSEKYQCDVAVAFVSSLGGKYVVDYADDFYDYKGYGYGPNDDGILLLVSVGDREFAEATHGYGIEAFTDYGLTNYLEPNFTRFLLNDRDDWAGAAEQFITDAGKLLEMARNGEPYDYHEPQRVQKSFKERAPFAALISAVIGFFSGGIPTGAMKRKMKTVEKEYGAANYARGGLNLRRQDDRFLYANVSRTPIPRQDEHRGGGGGGGSTVHFSSSGHSFGGSHGKF